jgi:hypothetical protein
MPRTECPSCHKTAAYDDLVGCSACHFVGAEPSKGLQDSKGRESRITVGKGRGTHEFVFYLFRFFFFFR